MQSEIDHEQHMGSALLPTLPAQSTLPAAPAPQTEEWKSKPVMLLVEDNYINTLTIGRILKDVCIVEHAEGAVTALTMAAQKRYDVILMDINLGAGMTGVEAVEVLRRMPEYSTVPIAAVTGYTFPEDKAKFLSQGFTHHLSKPFDREDILALAYELLQYR